MSSSLLGCDITTLKSRDSVKQLSPKLANFERINLLSEFPKQKRSRNRCNYYTEVATVVLSLALKGELVQNSVYRSQLKKVIHSYYFLDILEKNILDRHIANKAYFVAVRIGKLNKQMPNYSWAQKRSIYCFSSNKFFEYNISLYINLRNCLLLVLCSFCYRIKINSCMIFIKTDNILSVGAIECIYIDNSFIIKAIIMIRYTMFI